MDIRRGDYTEIISYDGVQTYFNHWRNGIPIGAVNGHADYTGQQPQPSLMGYPAFTQNRDIAIKYNIPYVNMGINTLTTDLYDEVQAQIVAKTNYLQSNTDLWTSKEVFDLAVSELKEDIAQYKPDTVLPVKSGETLPNIKLVSNINYRVIFIAIVVIIFLMAGRK